MMKSKENRKYKSSVQILNLILRNKIISRSSLVKKTGLTRAAVGQVVEDLTARKLIEDAGQSESRGGRPSQLLRPRHGAAYIIGAAMFDYSWSLVLTDLTGTVEDSIICKIDSSNPDDAAETLAGGVQKILEKHSQKNILPFLGVGAPGLVDYSRGVIINAIDLGWENIPFAAMIKEKTGMSVNIINRSKVSALSAYHLENDNHKPNIISIVVGTGVASGIIVNHSLFMGSDSGAGELGHTCIIPNGPACACGNRGCLQTLVSEKAILERGISLAGNNDKKIPSAIAEILCESDAEGFYHIIIEEVAEYLSIAVGNLINLFNPDLVVLSGPVISGCPPLIDLIRKKAAYRSMKHNYNNVVIKSSEHGIETAAIGSAFFILGDIGKYLLE